MPAKDRYHDTVIRALAKAGYRLEAEQPYIKLPERRLWIDMVVIRENRRLFIEVKSHRLFPSPVESLAASVGKYIIYRVALDRIRDTSELWLAIPENAYTSIFSQSIGRAVLQRAGVSLLVYDIEHEEIIGWNP